MSVYVIVIVRVRAPVIGSVIVPVTVSGYINVVSVRVSVVVGIGIW